MACVFFLEKGKLEKNTSYVRCLVGDFLVACGEKDGGI